MRVFVLALMIALLPLRGWVGDVMAMEPMAPSQAAHPHAAESAPAMTHCHEDQAEHAHHHGHAAATDAAQAASADDVHAAGDCGSCSLCQICHSVALTAVLPQLPAAVLPTAAPASSQPLYASAERALGDKPPIF